MNKRWPRPSNQMLILIYFLIIAPIITALLGYFGDGGTIADLLSPRVLRAVAVFLPLVLGFLLIVHATERAKGHAKAGLPVPSRTLPGAVAATLLIGAAFWDVAAPGDDVAFFWRIHPTLDFLLSLVNPANLAAAFFAYALVRALQETRVTLR